MRAFVIRAAFLVLLPASPVLLAGCGGGAAQGVTCNTDLGQTEAGRKVRLFIDTSDKLVRAANEIDADMYTVCRRGTTSARRDPGRQCPARTLGGPCAHS